MSKHNLDNDFEYQKRIDSFRLNAIDSFNEVKSTAFGGGWSKFEEDNALEALTEGLALLNLWREKNSINEDGDLAITPDGMVAVDESKLWDIINEARREGGRIPSAQDSVENVREKLVDEGNDD